VGRVGGNAGGYRRPDAARGPVGSGVSARTSLLAAVRRALTAKSSTGWHVTRYAMNLRIQALGPQLPARSGRALAVSHSRNLCELVGFEGEVVEADYPEHDLLDLSFDDEAFDLVVADQVLEHVEDPFRAISESLRVLRPGGVLIHTTCLLNPIHEDRDFWRFTPSALAHLVDGCVVHDVGGWGNRAVMPLKALGLHRLPVPDAPWHPVRRWATRSDPKWLASTWVVASKPPTTDQADSAAS
jgi:SAM-dependent methyltransferase